MKKSRNKGEEMMKTQDRTLAKLQSRKESVEGKKNDQQCEISGKMSLCTTVKITTQSG